MVMLGLIHEMKYHVRTGYGESAGCFGGPGLGLQGVYQENGAAPLLWELLSTVCFNVHKKEGHGVLIRCPITGESVRQAGISFVDNNNLWAGLDRRKDFVKCAADAQATVDSWGGCIHTTGGTSSRENAMYRSARKYQTVKGATSTCLPRGGPHRQQ